MVSEEAKHTTTTCGARREVFVDVGTALCDTAPFFVVHRKFVEVEEPKEFVRPANAPEVDRAKMRSDFPSMLSTRKEKRVNGIYWRDVSGREKWRQNARGAVCHLYR